MPIPLNAYVADPVDRSIFYQPYPVNYPNNNVSSSSLSFVPFYLQTPIHQSCTQNIVLPQYVTSAPQTSYYQPLTCPWPTYPSPPTCYQQPTFAPPVYPRSISLPPGSIVPSPNSSLGGVSHNGNIVSWTGGDGISYSGQLKNFYLQKPQQQPQPQSQPQQQIQQQPQQQLQSQPQIQPQQSKGTVLWSLNGGGVKQKSFLEPSGKQLPQNSLLLQIQEADESIRLGKELHEKVKETLSKNVDQAATRTSPRSILRVVRDGDQNGKSK